MKVVAFLFQKPESNFIDESFDHSIASKSLNSLKKEIIEKTKKEKKFETVEELEKHKAKNK